MLDAEIAVRSLTGTFHGTGEGRATEWPPSPFRLFQALRAGVATGFLALEADESDAFEWLESLPAPLIVAPDARTQEPYFLFVPNNDIDSVGGDPARVGSIKSEKRRQARAFDLATPIRYVWRGVDGPVPEALRAIVEALHTFGAGIDAACASLYVSEAADAPESRPGIRVWTPGSDGKRTAQLTVPVAGSLHSLEVRHRASLDRFASAGGTVRFSQPPVARYTRLPYGDEPSRHVIALRPADRAVGFYPIARTGVVSLVEAVAQRVLDAYPDDRELVERYVIGRGASAQDLHRRVRIVPLPSRGHAKADGLVRRVLVEIPQTSPLRPAAIAWALEGAAVADIEMRKNPTVLLSAEVRDQPVERGAVLSADTERPDTLLRRLSFGRESARWRSVTPVALVARADTAAAADNGASRRYLEAVRVRQFRTAVRQAGLPAPSAVRLQREPFGAGGDLASRYAFGTRFASSHLMHAEVRFPRPVRGPILIGDGRFRGLGLFEPIEAPQIPGFAFEVTPMVDATARYAFLMQVRRAVMARFARVWGSDLPALVSGHDKSGEKLADGRHRHLFFGPRLGEGGHLVGMTVLLPETIDRTNEGTSAREVRLLERSLDGFDLLTFGATTLAVRPAEVEPGGHTTHWTTATRFVSGRRPRSSDDRPKFVEKEVRRQLRSFGHPSPTSISVDGHTLRTDGLLSASLNLVFERPVSGPFLLGRDAHYGGGWLVPAST